MLSTAKVRKYLLLGFVVELGLLISGAGAAFWNVPGSPPTGFPDIQAAFNDPCVVSGDTITVAGSKTPGDPNVYVYSGSGFYDVDFLGKNVTLQAGGFRPWTVVIDCCSLGRAFIFQSGENNGAVLDGFIIINGYAEDKNWPQDPDVDASGYGGAMYCKNSTPRIMNCIITDCVADSGGGAIFCHADGDPNIIDCTISFNWAGYGFDKYGVHPNDANVANLKLRGGGIYCKDSSPVIWRAMTSCEISWNRVAGAGGGIACENSYAQISGCDIFENDAWVNDDRIIQHGGGVYCERGRPVIYRSNIWWNDARWSGGGVAVVDGNGVWVDECEITDNDSWASGGGIYSQGPSDVNEPNDPNIPRIPTCNVRKCLIADNFGYWCGGIASDYGSVADINNCTIANNVASWSHGPCLVGGLECYFGEATVRNCVIWGNTGLQVSPNDVDVVDIAYSDVQITDTRCRPDLDSSHVWPGEDNLNEDPLFVDPIRRDYHVQDPNIDIDELGVGMVVAAMTATNSNERKISPCINAGDPFADFSREPQPNGGRINIGAYGGTEEAARSDIKRPVAGDVDSDLEVNMVDFALLADDWLSEGAAIKNRRADANNDGSVNERDLAILSKFWLWLQ